MPPQSSSKGGSSKKASGAIAAMRGKDHPRSRTTTPNPVAPPAASLSAAAAAAATTAAAAAAAAAPPPPPPPPPSARLPPIEIVDTDYLEIRVEQFRNLKLEDLIDQPALPSTVIPDSRSIDALIARLQRLQETVDRRNMFFDRGMRLLVQARKNRPPDDDEDVPAKPEGGSSGAGGGGGDDGKGSRGAKADKADKKTKLKKRKADALTAGDGNLEKSPLDSHRPRKLSRDRDSVSSSLSPVEPASPNAMDVDEKEKVKAGSAAAAAEDDKKAVDAKDDDSDSEDEEPPPRREMPQAQTFGDDPSTFPDPTVYEIREVQPGMTEDEIRDIYSVATYPPSDLADLIAGDPPDKDFTAGKVTNQIAFFPTFSTYLEPYFRPYGEEDLAFLRERGDRTAPFVFPKRGKKHYTEVWAEEDGAMALDSPSRGDGLPPNQPRGTIENMDDDVAETDKLSIGPLVSRLLQAMRPESRIQVPAPAEDAKPAPASNGGDIVMGDAGDANDAAAAAQHPPAPPPPDSAPAAACFMPESSTEAWKKATHPKLDYHQVDERVKQELRYIGFLPLDNFDADYDGHFDDEVSARLRLLQGKLRDQILINGARKARLTDLVRERMAHQEYQTILEDLDTQVQGAYLKRTRTMGKSKKAKRPGGAGGGANAGGAAGAAGAGANAAGAGVARQGIGDMTKTLMERRRRWIDTIGKSVFDDPNLGRVPRSEDPDSSIFAPEVMVDLMKKEQEAWDEEVEEDDDG